MGMRYVSIEQTIKFPLCKMSYIVCTPPFWNVLVSWYPNYELDITANQHPFRLILEIHFKLVCRLGYPVSLCYMVDPDS